MSKKVFFSIIAICLLSVSCTLNFGLSGKVALQMPSGEILSSSYSKAFAAEEYPTSYTLKFYKGSTLLLTSPIIPGTPFIIDELDAGNYSIQIEGIAQEIKLTGQANVKVVSGKTTEIRLPLKLELVPKHLNFAEAGIYFNNYLDNPVAIKFDNDGNYSSAQLKSFIQDNFKARTAEAYVELDFSNCTDITTIDADTFNLSANTNGGKCIRKIILPSTVKSIGDQAFLDCINLTSINLENVETYGSRAFSACASLKRINLRDALSTGASSFINCSGLKEVILGNKIETIGDYCFSQCSELRKINIPASLTLIEASAFNQCNKLDTVIFEDTTTSWSKGFPYPDFTPSATDFKTNADNIKCGVNITKDIPAV